jgi:hypothetical protein
LTEAQIQGAVLDHWKKLGVPGSLVACIPNAWAQGQVGLTRGLFDLIVLSPLLGERTGWLELKTERGRTSIEQIELRDRFRELGVPHAITFGRDEPIEVLRQWGAVRA